MEKIDFIIEWAKEDEELTTYWGYPKVFQWVKKFYPEEVNKMEHPKAISNLRYYFNKLKNQNVLHDAHCVGLGFDAKINFFGTTKQWYWTVNKSRLLTLYGG